MALCGSISTCGGPFQRVPSHLKSFAFWSASIFLAHWMWAIHNKRKCGYQDQNLQNQVVSNARPLVCIPSCCSLRDNSWIAISSTPQLLWPSEGICDVKLGIALRPPYPMSSSYTALAAEKVVPQLQLLDITQSFWLKARTSIVLSTFLCQLRKLVSACMQICSEQHWEGGAFHEPRSFFAEILVMWMTGDPSSFSSTHS